MQRQAARLGQRPGIAALVVALVLGEFPGEGVHRLIAVLARRRRDHARVKPAAEVGGDGNVASQVQLHRLLEQRAELLLEVVRGVVEVDVVVDLPVADGLAGAAADAQEMARGQLLDALEQRLAVEAELEREVIPERVGIGLDRGQERQQRLSL